MTWQIIIIQDLLLKDTPRTRWIGSSCPASSCCCPSPCHSTPDWVFFPMEFIFFSTSYCTQTHLSFPVAGHVAHSRAAVPVAHLRCEKSKHGSNCHSNIFWWYLAWNENTGPAEDSSCRTNTCSRCSSQSHTRSQSRYIPEVYLLFSRIMKRVKV